MHSNSHRPFMLAGVAGGVCWIVMAIGALTSPARPEGTRVVLTETSDYVGMGVFAAALVFTVFALFGLHRLHRGADGGLGRAGASVAMLGCAAQSVVIGTIVVTGEEPAWFGIAAPVAILTWFLGSIAFGVAIRRAGVLPRWAGVLLPIVTLFAIVGSEGGTSILIGVFLIEMGRRAVSAPSLRTASA